MNPLDYVLIVVVYISSGMTSHSVDFKTMEACQQAQRVVMESARKSIKGFGINNAGISATCHKR